MRSNIEDYNAVVKAAEKFTRSVAEGNSKYAKELFTEDACLFGYLNGQLERGSIEQFYHNVDTVGAGEQFKTRIDILELEETLAVVRVLEEGWGGSIDFTDDMLRSSSLSVADVCYSLGFENPTHFSRIYHERFGHAPSMK